MLRWKAVRSALACAAVIVVSHMPLSIAGAQEQDELSPEQVARLKAAAAAAEANLPMPSPTAQIVVDLKAGADPFAVARDHGLAVVMQMVRPGSYLMQAATIQNALGVEGDLRADSRVASLHNNERTINEKFFVPNDPYFGPGGGFPGQWHLFDQVAAAVVDTKIMKPWLKNLTGTGVKTSTVDDGLQTAHPDIAPNYNAADSFDWGQGNADPNPVYGSDNHGTSTSGVMAARGGNAIGGTGAAPLAMISCQRIDFPLQTSAMFENGTLYHSAGGNTNLKVKNHSYGYSSPYITTAAQAAAFDTSIADGTIHTVSAGNNRGGYGGIAEDANTLDNQNQHGMTTVAALASSGIFSDYSSYGTNVACTAPSSSFRAGELGILTTDRTGGSGYNSVAGGGDGDAFPDLDYTSTFGGTSSSAPLVGGIAALIKQQLGAALNGPLFKHMLSRTCSIVDAASVRSEDTGKSGGWFTNAAGKAFNNDYGWGNINATNLWKLGKETMAYSSGGTILSSTGSPGLLIPDNNLTGVTGTYTASAVIGPLEEIEVNINITHTYQGDIEVLLTSPQGTTARLVNRNSSASADNIVWTYSSNAFWGENPIGVWTVRVRDVFAIDTGTWNSFSVRRWGGSLVPTVPKKPKDLIKTGFTGTGKPKFAWADKSLVEDGYRLYRRVNTPQGAWSVVVTTGPNGTAATDVSAVSGQKYDYKVVGFNGQGEGGASNIVTVNVP